MKNHFYCFVLFLLFILPLHAPAQDRSADSLARADVMRPIDLVQPNPHWNTASPDLFTHWIDSGLYGYYGPQPKIMLDGIPVDANFFGWQNLDMLPIYIEDIKHVQYRHRPGVYHNSLSGNMINFASSAADTGLHISASGYVGNETGDPGPWVYDSSKVTPNVDRWGPYGSGRISYRQNGWFAKGIYSFSKTQPTDIRSHRRLRKQMGVDGSSSLQPIIINKSGLLETGYASGSWKIRARGISGKSKDYLFLPAFGREIPSINSYQQLAASAEYQSRNWILQLDYLLNNKYSSYRPNTLHYNFDWRQKKHKIATSAQYLDERTKIKWGSIYELLRTSAPGLNGTANNLYTLFTDLKLNLSQNSRLTAHGSLDFGNNSIAKNFRLGVDFKRPGKWTFRPTLFYTELLPVRQQSFSYWSSRGYTFNEDLGLYSGQITNISSNRLLAVELKGRWVLSDEIHFSTTSNLIRHYNLMVTWQEVSHSPTFDASPGLLTVTGESGRRLSLTGNISHSPASFVRQELNIRYQKTLSGTQRYTDYFKQIPEIRVGYSMNVRATDNLIFTTSAIYYSPRYWREYRALEGKTFKSANNHFPPLKGTFSTKTLSYINLDISLRKWLLQKRMSLQLAVRNILDQEVRMHPLGARLSTKFDVRVILQL